MRRVLTILALMVGVAAAGLAQESTGALLGTITDQAGAVVPGATVEITSAALGRTLKLTTDERGEYVFPSLPPGEYTVTATRTGFAAARLAGVPLPVGRTIQVDLKLELSRVTESVSVSSRVPLIDIVSSVSMVNISAKEIDLLPKMPYQALAAGVPGAQQEPKNGLQIDGASGAENAWFINGVDTTSLFLGTSAKNLPIEWVQELQVKSGGIEAEHGGAQGGVVHALTKSGDNQIHGQFNYYYWGSRLRADPRPRLRLNPVDVTKAEYIRDPKQPDRTNEFGFNVGGPVLKNKIWYFLGYQPSLYRAERTVYFPRYNVTRSYAQTQTTQNWTARLSLQPWDRLRVNVGAISGALNVRGSLPGWDGSVNPDGGFERQGWREPNISYSGDASLRVTRKLFFNFRGGYFLEDAHQYGIPIQIQYIFQGSPASYWNEMAPEFRQQAGWRNITSNSVQKYATNTRMTASVDGNWFADFFGEHSLKFGYATNRLGMKGDSGNQADVLTFSFGNTWENVTVPGTTTRGRYGYYMRRVSGDKSDAHAFNHALFLQDSWRARRRLHLNLGIRAECEAIPSSRTAPGVNPNAIAFPFSQKLAPRLGAAYDLFGNGRTKIYGSFGLYYDLMKYYLAPTFGGYVDYRWYYTLDTLDIGSIGNGNYPGKLGEMLDLYYPPNFPQDPKINPLVPLDLGGKTRIDPNLKPMRSREYTLGLDRMAGSNWVFNLRYARKRLDHAVEDTGVLSPASGVVLFIANPGFGLSNKLYGPGCDPQYGGGADCAKFPAYPTARRRYDGLEVRAQRRFARHWQGAFGYTLSHLTGTYGGLQQAEYNTLFPNAAPSYDVPWLLVTAEGKLNDGVLATDRRHTFSSYGSYSIPIKRHEFTLGGNFSAGSGIPFWLTGNVLTSGYPMMLEGRSSQGRKAGFALTNLFFAQEFKTSERTRLRIHFTLTNAFDQTTPTNYAMNYYTGVLASGVPGSPITANWMFTRGFDYKQQIRLQANDRRPASCGSFEQDPYCATARLKLDPRFMKANAFQAPLEGRLGIRFSF